MSKIWVYIDQFKGQALPTSWETIGAAKALGGSITALVFGQNVEAVANEAFQYGADEVLLADDVTLGDYRAVPETRSLLRAVQRRIKRKTGTAN